MTINTIKFFYNGIKINGDKNLIKVKMYESGDDICVLYDWRWDRDFFEAIQEIVDYTVITADAWDYEPTRKLKVDKNNPLYNYFKYTVLAAKKRDLKMIGKDYSEIDSILAKMNNFANSDIVKSAKDYINAINDEKKALAEKARQEEEAEYKRIFEEEKSQKKVILNYMNRFPIGDSNLYVRICWSEHPAFYDWNDNELTLSVKAAELVLAQLDRKPIGGGYYKTKFQIIEDGEVIYTGRYDLGDEENGLLNHLKSYADYEYKNNGESEDYKEYTKFILKLIENYDRQTEIKVSFADGFHEFVENFKKNKGV